MNNVAVTVYKHVCVCVGGGGGGGGGGGEKGEVHVGKERGGERDSIRVCY